GYIHYMDRYIEEPGSVYKIYKDTTTEMQIIETGGWSQPYKVYVKDGSNNPVSGIRINYEADMPAISEKFVEFTDNLGVSSNRIKIGDKPLDYYLTARCMDCVSEQNSVRFSCCGKLKNDHFSQSGQSWSPICYANNNCQINPNATIGWRGCALTALATLINYYSDNVYPTIPRTDPGSLNNYLRGLPIPQGYNERNDVNFDSIEQYSDGAMRYINNESDNIRGNITQQVLLKRANSELLAGRPVIFRIFRGDNRYHFVVVIGKCGNNYIIADPAGGIERLYNPNETGYVLSGIRIFRP
ncbi:MAG: C39 family peptidase, partial [Elusimicrobiales bacterium]